MRNGRLLTQVLVINLTLMAAAVISVSFASDPTGSLSDSATVGIVLSLSVAAMVGINFLLLQRRFEPLERLVEQMENADLNSADEAEELPPLEGSQEVRRLDRTFRDMLARLEAERRRSATAALAAQERERSRIALDLHDEVNQALTGLLLRLETLRRKAPAELEDELEQTSAVAAAAMEELLALARQLRPTSLDDLGLAAALGSLSEEIGRRTGITTDFNCRGDFSPVPDEIQLVAYRVAQEALSNAIQHAQPRHLQVRLQRLGDGLELRVIDDGAGFKTGSSGSNGGLGLAGMRERAMLVGGAVEIESRPSEGTRVRLTA
jgi:two-component system sensor histidine kinase UhpB